jgi:hypothetical protein
LHAVQEPVVGFLAQNLLLLDKRVLLSKESLISGERPTQRAFHVPMSCQLTFVARDRAALVIFKNGIRKPNSASSMAISLGISWLISPALPRIPAWSLETSLKLKLR